MDEEENEELPLEPIAARVVALLKRHGEEQDALLSELMKDASEGEYLWCVRAFAFIKERTIGAILGSIYEEYPHLKKKR